MIQSRYTQNGSERFCAFFHLPPGTVLNGSWDADFPELFGTVLNGSGTILFFVGNHPERFRTVLVNALYHCIFRIVLDFYRTI